MNLYHIFDKFFNDLPMMAIRFKNIQSGRPILIFHDVNTYTTTETVIYSNMNYHIVTQNAEIVIEPKSRK